MAIAIGILLITNAVSLVYLVRARRLNKKIFKNADLLTQYIEIHNRLQRASGCLIELRRLESENMFYVEPK